MLLAMADKVVPMDVRLLVIDWPERASRGEVSRFCREHGVSRSWFYEVRQRALTETALSALQPRPRSLPIPHPQAVPLAVEDAAVRIRKELADGGWDHGARTVRQKLRALGVPAPAASTLHRIFVRHGLVDPQPQKRPRSAMRRFEYALVNEAWQGDAYEWSLAEGTGCAVFNILDDCSRTVRSHAAAGETADAAIDAVERMIERYQAVPCLFLSDNGTAFNQTRLGRSSRLIAHLSALGCHPITGRPGHPQTQGKDERVHQTQQRWLRAHPAARTVEALQELLDEFDERYNHDRPHQALGMLTPAQARAQRPHALPPQPPGPKPARVAAEPVRARPRKVSTNGNLCVGKITIRMGVEHTNQPVTVLTSGHHITVFDGRTGKIIRTITVEPSKRYYSNGRPRSYRSTTNRPH